MERKTIMRKLFWCCLAAGAAMCCAAGAVVFVCQYPDSPLGCCVRIVGRVTGRGSAPAPHPGQPAVVADADDLIPPAPTPADESPDPPAPPEPGSHLPPSVAALIPPIVIHEDDDLNGNKTQPPAAAPADVERPVRADGPVAADHPAPAPMMPHCAADDPAPQMPRCDDDEDDGKVGGAYQPFDACAFWMAFFSVPTRLFPDPSAARCEEDATYPQQYPGCPYTGRACMPEPPARGDARPLRVFPGADVGPEEADPLDLFHHPRHLPKAAVEPQSDTMEMRPTDWKPYNLDPGPF
jgi:hypothetical protein